MNELTIILLCATISAVCYLIGKKDGAKEEAKITEKAFAESMDRILDSQKKVLAEFLDEEAQSKYWKKLLFKEIEEFSKTVLK